MPLSCDRPVLVRLRSIGDTVLMTPLLSALKAWRPNLPIAVVTEPLAAPLLEPHPLVDELLVIPRARRGLVGLGERARSIGVLRAGKFDIAFNLHGGTTAAWLMRLAGIPQRVGYALPNTRWLLTQVAPPPTEIWQKPTIHCVEQQLGLLKMVGVPLPTPLPRTKLYCAPKARAAVAARLRQAGVSGPYAVVHPAAAFPSKQWAASHFAETMAHLARRGLQPVVIVGPGEEAVANAIRQSLPAVPGAVFLTDLPLSETMAVIAGSALFVGNDSGPAHIAAAFERPLVVIFGSSNDRVWSPWTNAPHQVVRHRLPCVPCAGPLCHAFPEPECIRRITVGEVTSAIAAVLAG
ncbi:glycosyltransferase family 9 protein [Chloracidobacterium validum]|uniref:Glycosyltransferase family 9 protein n=1 Tax=Chloracidobacterium validum TaxID=2821543 RepID=A0ABX8B4T4_9BACT|nr:glycosyltransferase family 9 protein [Chloracidobacterium validum]QUW01992.1 glycosyltransferase family 9 protein [Chloracidobacterium validum]